MQYDVFVSWKLKHSNSIHNCMRMGHNENYQIMWLAAHEQGWNPGTDIRYQYALLMDGRLSFRMSHLAFDKKSEWNNVYATIWVSANDLGIGREVYLALSVTCTILVWCFWPPCQQSDMTLVEVSQHAFNYFFLYKYHIRSHEFLRNANNTIVLFVFLRNSCEPDMVLVYFC